MRTQIIAEIGSNHAGNMDIAKEMIRVAAECGVDYVKFQSWQAQNLKPGDPNYERHKLAELSDEDHYTLIEECGKQAIGFLTSVFDVHRVDFLASLGLKLIKVPSPDLGSLRLLGMLRDKFEHVIISTGMSYTDEIVKTAEFMQGYDYTFLHCVSLYPTPLDQVNMSRMDWLRQFTPSVGFSDHTMGTEAGKLAIARGAAYVEKHFTIDRNLPGKDQAMSSEPPIFTEMADYAREVEIMMGEAQPVMTENEAKLRDIYIGKWGDNR